jgi:PAS domain S-box-containing protein
MRRAHGRGRDVVVPGTALAGLLLAVCPCAFGLNPALDVSQYAHTAWKIRRINSIAQTPDGYLWVGTDFGLLRFDGVRSVEWAPPAGKQLPSNDIRKLLVTRDGRLWIGTSKGLASWKDSRLADYPELAGSPVLSILQDSQGTTWAGETSASPGRLCAIQSGNVQCYGEDGRFGQGVAFLYEHKGNLWAGAANGLWRWKPGPPKLYPILGPAPDLHDLIEGDNGALWLAMRGGIIQLVDGKAERYPLPVGGQFNPSRLLRDREGGLWIGTYGQGLIHVHQGRTDVFTSADGLSADFINGLFEDREGNIWTATLDGLDRFRDVAVPDISFKQGLSGDVVYSVLAARDGSVWLATSNGLKRWKDGQITIYRKRGDRSAQGVPPRSVQQPPMREIDDSGLPDNAVGSLFQDERGRIWGSTLRGMVYFEDGRFIPVGSVPGEIVHAIAEDRRGTLWIANQNFGLLSVSRESEVQQIPWAGLGRKDFATALAADPLRGGLWLGFRQGGVVYFADGQVRASYPAGFGEGLVNDLQLDRDGTLWAATDGGLSRLKNGRVATLTRKNGLPCDAVHWVIEDDAGSLWLFMACDLVRIARPELDAWAAAVDAPLDKDKDEKRTVQATVFDSSDGVRIRTNAGGYSPQVSKSPDGKLWFAFLNGVSVIDPRHLPANKVPPPVHIEQIIADDKSYDLRPGMRLPANVRNLRINYTALSLVAPEKVHFKYKLEGQNQNWHEVINERQAFYTNLPPRNYRFRVIASNNSGVWNEAGDTLEFSIAPAYYQTNWFRAFLAAAVLALMGAAYQFRIWQVQRESRRLRDVIETIPAYVWSALPDGLVDFINRRWLEFSGFSLNQALGWGWADALHPEDRVRLLQAWRGAIMSGKPMEAEARMRSADGQYRWLLFRSVPQHDPSGKIVKWYGKSMDIDDRKRAEETLRETETRFRTYIDHATDAFFVLDFEGGTILDVNRRACENLGYTREEVIGKTVFDFDAGLNPAWLDQNIRPRIEAGENVTFETRHRRKDGSVFPVEIRARAFRIGGRDFNLSLALDITERKQSEEERERLRQLEADLAHINRVNMMGELSASIAHEINQPLAGIVSNGSASLRWLAGNPANVEEAREALRDIVRDGKRAGEVIARIRALTKRTALPREKLDLNETIREVLALVGDEAKRESMVIRTQFADDLSPVLGDRVQLQQVLLNLVMNAMDAMSSAGERQLVITTQDIDQERVQVTVEDSGTGLDPNTMARIFEPFYTTKSGGMGMGLSISRSIVQNHGGRLWATANDGPGTSFHFTLPKYQREESNAGAAAV